MRICEEVINLINLFEKSIGGKMNKPTIAIFLLLAVLLAGGCQTAETSNANTSATGGTAGAKPAATTASLKPEVVSPDKPVPAGDLKDAVTANLNAWKGKEVTVVGNYISNAPTKDGNTGKLLSVQVNLTDTKKSIAVACVSDKDMPADYLTQRENRVVKGKVKEVTSFGQVKLEPCECVK
jgi:hypothetical protein